MANCILPHIWFLGVCYLCTEGQRLDVTYIGHRCVDECDGFGLIESSIGIHDNFCICGPLYVDLPNVNGCGCRFNISIDGETCVQNCPANSTSVGGTCTCNAGYAPNVTENVCVPSQANCNYPYVWYQNHCHFCNAGQYLDITLVTVACVSSCTQFGTEAFNVSQN